MLERDFLSGAGGDFLDRMDGTEEASLCMYNIYIYIYTYTYYTFDAIIILVANNLRPLAAWTARRRRAAYESEPFSRETLFAASFLEISILKERILTLELRTFACVSRSRRAVTLGVYVKGTNGSALMGSLQLSFLLRDFWGTPANLLLPYQKCQGIPFSPICQKYYFCSGPISADPICPQPKHRPGYSKPGLEVQGGFERRATRWHDVIL